MRRDTAERIVDLVKASGDLFNELTLLTFEIEDEIERKAVRRALAELILDVHEKITLKIVAQFPDLHPYKER
jgi:hypothetical protein